MAAGSQPVHHLCNCSRPAVAVGLQRTQIPLSDVVKIAGLNPDDLKARCWEACAPVHVTNRARALDASCGGVYEGVGRSSILLLFHSRSCFCLLLFPFVVKLCSGLGRRCVRILSIALLQASFPALSPACTLTSPKLLPCARTRCQCPVRLSLPSRVCLQLLPCARLTAV